MQSVTDYVGVTIAVPFISRMRKCTLEMNLYQLRWKPLYSIILLEVNDVNAMNLPSPIVNLNKIYSNIPTFVGIIRRMSQWHLILYTRKTIMVR